MMAADMNISAIFLMTIFIEFHLKTAKEVSIMIFDKIEDINPVKDYEYEETHFNIVKEFKAELLDIKNKSGINVYELINICIMNYLNNLEELVDEYTPSEAMDILKKDHTILLDKLDVMREDA